MFICLDCCNVFEEPIYWEETHGLNYGPYEWFSGCPNCSGAYTKTYCCDACGEWIDTDTYIEIGDERYCEDCFTIKNLGE